MSLKNGNSKQMGILIFCMLVNTVKNGFSSSVQTMVNFFGNSKQVFDYHCVRRSVSFFIGGVLSPTHPSLFLLSRSLSCLPSLSPFFKPIMYRTCVSTIRMHMYVTHLNGRHLSPSFPSRIYFSLYTCFWFFFLSS